MNYWDEWANYEGNKGKPFGHYERTYYQWLREVYDIVIKENDDVEHEPALPNYSEAFAAEIKPINNGIISPAVKEAFNSDVWRLINAKEIRKEFNELLA